ncbi:hypothetical protein CPB83DRAFT_832907 [Crepidotus variabilis]|uniref:Uncharacterized protein n=1 Tax=Crepidotus variabilis TaxID=179855 RepID=A0A9P6JSS2_9AGAR|nr:hypothetical protein CPB83DRAFT_832907 [Crepidotus variabilis]
MTRYGEGDRAPIPKKSHHGAGHLGATNEVGQVIYKVESGGPTLGARRMMVSKIAPAMYKEKLRRLAPVPVTKLTFETTSFTWARLNAISYFQKLADQVQWAGSVQTELSQDLMAKTTAGNLLSGFARYSSKELKLLSLSSTENNLAFSLTLDLIVLTFVYVEKLRKDKERASRPRGGGGP